MWRQNPQQQRWLEAREGAYLLRTNLTVDGAADLWKKYMQLTEVETAFRPMKSELAEPSFAKTSAETKNETVVRSVPPFQSRARRGYTWSGFMPHN